MRSFSSFGAGSSRKALVLASVLVAMVAMDDRSQAQIILNSANQSNVENLAYFDGDAGTTATNEVNSFPFVTPTTATDQTVTSTVTSALTTGALNFNFTQSLPDGTSEAQGQATIYFTVGSNLDFTISGNAALAGGADIGAQIFAELLDTTTDTLVYRDVIKFPGPGATSLDSSSYPLTGNLISGDSYEFNDGEVSGGGAGPGNLGGSLTGAIDFTTESVPEPSSDALLLAGFGTLALLCRRVRACPS